MKTKKFGWYVNAFEGRKNLRPLSEYVGVKLAGDILLWLTPLKARQMAENLLAAADYVETHKKKRTGRDP